MTGKIVKQSQTPGNGLFSFTKYTSPEIIIGAMLQLLQSSDVHNYKKNMVNKLLHNIRSLCSKINSG